MGVKLTAAKIGITRVTLWSIRTTGNASATTMKRIALVLSDLNHLNLKIN